MIDAQLPQSARIVLESGVFTPEWCVKITV